MKTITDWFLLGSRVTGVCGLDRIITSSVVGLENDVITTKSGSNYRLENPVNPSDKKALRKIVLEHKKSKDSQSPSN